MRNIVQPYKIQIQSLYLVIVSVCVCVCGGLVNKHQTSVLFSYKYNHLKKVAPVVYTGQTLPLFFRLSHGLSALK